MIFHLTVSGKATSEYVKALQKELAIHDVACEIHQAKGETVGEGKLYGWESAAEILRIGLTPGILTLICGAIVKICLVYSKHRPKIKLKIGENSLEISGSLDKTERDALLKRFLYRVSELEDSNKNLYGFLYIEDIVG